MRGRLVRAVGVVVGCSSLLVSGAAGTARANETDAPVVHLRHFASAPAGATKPDDITGLDGVLWVTYQNNAPADGSQPGTHSTIVGFDHSGHVVQRLDLPGRCDGLAADPTHDRLLATVNEDAKSSLFVIEPDAKTAPRHYTYSPDPSDGTANGGTDGISIAPDGTVYVAHSNPDPIVNNANTAAVYTLTLHATTATLIRLFGINDPARVIDPAPHTPHVAPLGLTDPDSNRFLPGRHGGTLIQVAQADSKLVLATDLHADEPRLRQLDLTNATAPPSLNPDGSAVTPQLDDIERISGPGVLYVVDQKTGDIWTLDTTNLEPGTIFASQPAPSSGDQPNTPALAAVDLRTGLVTHVDSTLQSPKGLLFIPTTTDSDNHHHHDH